MSTVPPPSWIRVRPGTVPVVLLAPHGGRRTASRLPGHHKVNDLHTASFTEALAARTGATAIVNAERDRNELDLNRIAQVRAAAPWLPALLADVLEQAVAGGRQATLLVIHGWNIGQPACDVGIGAIERAGRLAEVRPGSRTVTDAFLQRTLPSLRRRGAAAGMAVTVGARYPAAHPNNLLQLFTAAYEADADPDVRRLGRLAAAARIDAVQLELGIPLRWPGPMRDRLLELLAALLGAAAPAPGGRRADAPPRRLACRGRVVERRALQFVHDDLFGLSAVEAGASGSVGGRLLLSSGTGTVELFTGELGDRTGPRWHVPPLRYGDDPDQWQLRYRGSLLSFATLEPFLDLENGLAGGHLVAADIDLEFRAHASDTLPARATFGDLAGRVVVGERTTDVRTIALRTDGAPAPRGLPTLRLVLPRTPRGALLLTSTAGEVRHEHLRFTLRAECHRSGELERFAASATVRPTPAGALLSVRLGEDEVTGHLERLIPIRRPGRSGARPTLVHTTYGLCRLAGMGASGWSELVTEHETDVTDREP